MTTRIHDKNFNLIIDEPSIKLRIRSLAREIAEKYSDKVPLFTCVLSGAFVFMADLIRAYGHPCETAFIKASSYKGMKTSGEVVIKPTADYRFKGKDVIIIEDIVDTGLTLQALRTYFAEQGVASLAVASLLVKPDAHQVSTEVEYAGFLIDPLFVVGYGLDYDGQGRQLSGIYQLYE